MSMLDDFDAPLPARLDWRLWRRYLRRALAIRGPLLGVLGGGLGLALVESIRPLVVAAMIDEVARDGWTPWLSLLLAGWFGLVVVFAITVWLFIAAAGRLASRLAFRLREDGDGVVSRGKHGPNKPSRRKRRVYGLPLLPGRFRREGSAIYHHPHPIQWQPGGGTHFHGEGRHLT